MRSPPKTQYLSWASPPRRSPVSPGSFTQGLTTCDPSGLIRAITPGVPVPTNDWPTVKPAWHGLLRTLAMYTSSVSPLMALNGVWDPSAAIRSKLFGTPLE